jgi:HAD superfamily hydrolase (TIGR01509 family)
VSARVAGHESGGHAHDPFALVIFDCDGVLVDSERIIIRILGELLAEQGAPMAEDEIVHVFVGRSERAILHAVGEQIAAQGGRAVTDDIGDRYRTLYRDAFEQELRRVDGVDEALAAIGLPSCVASSSTVARLRHTLELTGLLERFEGRIFSAEQVAHGKPAPDLFLFAAASLGVAPAACAVIEDSQYGVQAARAAGMRSFGYAGGLTDAAALAGPGTVVFSDMRELPGLLR